jgi:YD repeat-containing protein
MGMRASYGGRAVLLLLLVSAGFVGLALQGSSSSADDSDTAGAVVARPALASLLKDAQPVTSLDTDTSQTYRRPDGTMVTRVFAQSADADPALSPAVGGGWTADSHGGSEQFPASLADPVKVTRGAAWVSMSLLGGAGTGATKGSAVTYTDALPGVAVTYQASDGAVGEDLRLTAADAPSSYAFDLAASDGVHPVTERNGTVALLDGDDHQLFSLSPSYAFADRDPTVTQKVTTALTTTDGGWRVTLSVDATWLRDALADGPVTIDPTVQLQGATKDCYLTSDTPTLSFCADTALYAGWNGTRDRHSLIKWDVSAIPQDALILSGDAGLYQGNSTVSIAKSLTLHRVTRDWTNGASWNTYDGTHAWTTAGGDYDPTPAATATDPAHNNDWVDWYPTGLIQHWVDGSLPNYGVLVRDDGTHTTGQEGFQSTESGNTATEPELDILWTTRAGTPDAFTFESQNVDAKTAAGVNAANGNLVLTTKDVAVAGEGGLDLDFSHYYNSIADPTVIGGVGLQTTGSLGRDVHLGHLYGPDLAFSSGDGLTVPFSNPHTTGTTKTFDTPSELSGARLTQDTSTNIYTLDLPTGLPAWRGMHQVLTFDASGALTTLADTQDHHLSFSYYDSGYTNPPSLGGITDTNNDDYDVDRSADGDESIDNIADPSDAHHWRFAYDSVYGTLTRATSIDNTRYQYAYDSSHRLTKITTPTGAVWLITYNGTTRQVASVVQTTDAAHTTGPTTTFAYSSPTSPCQSTNFDYTKSVVRRPDNSSTTYCANDHAQITYDTDNPSAATPSGDWYDLHDQYTQGAGTHSITIAGADAGSGVKKLTLERTSGSEVASTTLPCDPRNAQNPTACPHTATQTATFDPSAIPEGAQSFDVKTTDYAGRTVTSSPWTVKIDRSAPTVPTGFSVDFEDETGQADVSWNGALDPVLPDSTPGAGLAGYTYRYRQGSGGWSAWADQSYPGFSLLGSQVGQTIEVEVTDHDAVGNTSVAGSALMTVTADPNTDCADHDSGAYPSTCIADKDYPMDSDDPDDNADLVPADASSSSSQRLVSPQADPGDDAEDDGSVSIVNRVPITPARTYLVRVSLSDDDDPNLPPSQRWASIRNNAGTYTIGNVKNGWQVVADQRVSVVPSSNRNDSNSVPWLRGVVADPDGNKISGPTDGCGFVIAKNTSDDAGASPPPAPGGSCTNFNMPIQNFTEKSNCPDYARSIGRHQCNHGTRVYLDNDTRMCANIALTESGTSTGCAVNGPNYLGELHAGHCVEWRYITRDKDPSGRYFDRSRQYMMVKVRERSHAEVTWLFIRRTAIDKPSHSLPNITSSGTQKCPT